MNEDTFTDSPEIHSNCTAANDKLPECFSYNVQAKTTWAPHILMGLDRTTSGCAITPTLQMNCWTH